MSDFYKNIKPFQDFSESFESKNYKKAPGSWFVVITDIKGSTIAVSQGRYKDVNMIGAASIAAVNEAGDFPYVFGGDGASLIVSKEKLDSVKKELLKVKKVAKERFSLDLRIGVVPIKDLEARGLSIKVAKYELGQNKFVAKFSGGGLELADNLIKAEIKYQIQDTTDEDFSFNNLSCRWSPISSSNGQILTLIIKNKNFNSYKKTFSHISKILKTVESNPVKINSMKYKSLWNMLKEEYKYPGKKKDRIIQIVFCFIFFIVLKGRTPEFLKKYSNSIKEYSDFMKFDDALRMVIDCSVLQSKEIIKRLEENPEIDFGYHKSSTALMTCLVYDLNDGGHIHFIDGDGGGYTLAAKMLKEKVKNKAKESQAS